MAMVIICITVILRSPKLILAAIVQGTTYSKSHTTYNDPELAVYRDKGCEGGKIQRSEVICPVSHAAGCGRAGNGPRQPRTQLPGTAVYLAYSMTSCCNKMIVLRAACSSWCGLAASAHSQTKHYTMWKEGLSPTKPIPLAKTGNISPSSQLILHRYNEKWCPTAAKRLLSREQKYCTAHCAGAKGNKGEI